MSFAFLHAHLFAQTNGKAYAKGAVTLSAGYGFVNLWEIFLNKVYDIPDYNVKSTGPLTLIIHYGFTRRFSAGLTGSYSRINGKAEKYQLSDQITFLSLLASANYHFLTKEKFDPYFGAGIGISNSKYKNLDTHTILPDALNKKVPGTLDFSGQVGIKYFPLKFIGLFAEGGYVNGAVLHIGVTTKL